MSGAIPEPTPTAARCWLGLLASLCARRSGCNRQADTHKGGVPIGGDLINPAGVTIQSAPLHFDAAAHFLSPYGAAWLALYQWPERAVAKEPDPTH